MKTKLLFFFLTFWLPTLVFCGEETTVLGELVLVDGGVTLSEGIEAYPLAVGQPLADGDEIITDKDGSAEVTLGDRNQFLLAPNSRLKVLKAPNGKGLLLNLDQGLIRAKLDNWNKEESFSIRTPSAVAGVRGTDFIVEASGQDEAGFELDVVEGTVEVDSGELKGERIGAGKGLRLDLQGRIKERREVLREEVRERLQKGAHFREALKAKWAQRKKASLQNKFKDFNREKRQNDLKDAIQKRKADFMEKAKEKKADFMDKAKEQKREHAKERRERKHQ